MLNVTTLKIADTTFVRCQGKIIVGEDWAPLLSAVLNQVPGKVVVLDLACVKRVDAGGLGVLLALRKGARANGVRFKLMNARPGVQRVIHLTGLDRIFEYWSVRDMLELMHIARAADAFGGSWLSQAAV